LSHIKSNAARPLSRGPVEAATTSAFSLRPSRSTWSHGQAGPTASRIGSIQGVRRHNYYSRLPVRQIRQITVPSKFCPPIYRRGRGGHSITRYHPLENVSGELLHLGPRLSFVASAFEGYGKALFGVGHYGLRQVKFRHPNPATTCEYALVAEWDIHVKRHITPGYRFRGPEVARLWRNTACPRFPYTFGASMFFTPQITIYKICASYPCRIKLRPSSASSTRFLEGFTC